MQPYFQAEKSQTGPPKLVHDPWKKAIIEQQYQLNKNGKFLLTINQYHSNEGTEEWQKEAVKTSISFNGEFYHCVSLSESDEPGLASIFTPEHPFDYSKPMIKPTYFMDHVFNDDILKILKDDENTMITVTEEDMWRLEYQDPESDKFYHLELDPKHDFMITRMTGYWNVGQTFEKNMEYDQTEEGFYCLKRGTLSINGKEPTIMEVREFELNGPEGNYTLEIPIGSRVTDHTKGFKQIYYQGQPGRTSEETGDINIYTLADSIDRIALEGIEEMMRPLKNIEPNAKDVQHKIQESTQSTNNQEPNSQNDTNSAIDVKVDNKELKDESGKFRYVVISAAILLILVGAILYSWRKIQK
jgi:hypothetical protein